MNEPTPPGNARRTGRQMVADSLASVVPGWALDGGQSWQDVADDLLDDLDEKGLLVVHETFLLALKNGADT